MSEQRRRQPRGVPGGGEFAKNGHGEAGVPLSDTSGDPAPMTDEGGASLEVGSLFSETASPHEIGESIRRCLAEARASGEVPSSYDVDAVTTRMPDGSTIVSVTYGRSLLSPGSDDAEDVAVVRRAAERIVRSHARVSRPGTPQERSSISLVISQL